VSSIYRFPGHYPENGCPPVDTELRGEYYRLVPHADRSPRRKDFRSYYERNLDPELEATKPCYRRSVSVYTDPEDLHRVLRLYPGKQERCIIRLHLRGGHGIVEHTPSAEDGKSHHDWWIPLGVDPCAYFDSHVGGPYP
jgi:hypothetical protein